MQIVSTEARIRTTKWPAKLKLNGILLNLPERITAMLSCLMFRTLRRRDDKQGDANKYGQQNRHGDMSAKFGQKPNQTPGQQTQDPNQGGQQSGGQQRGPQRLWKRTARFDEQFWLAKFFQLPIRVLRHFPFLAHDALRSMPSEEVAMEHQFFIRQQNLKLYRSLVAASEAAAAKADARQEKLLKLLAEEVANEPLPRKN